MNTEEHILRHSGDRTPSAAECRTPSNSAAFCRELHIYYIQGRLKREDERLGPAFLGNWEEEGFSFLFFSAPAPHEIEKLLSRNPELILTDEFRMSYEDWHGGKITPFAAGRFLIVPPWEDISLHPRSDLRIVLDPGVVFGTGMHPTTRDCLEMITRAYQEETVGTVLDLGTGTGLLALAAARMGSGQVLAVDFNFLAVKTAARNVKLNCLEDKILAVQGRAEAFISYPADLLIANIHYDVMKHLIESQGFLNKKQFILSGLLRSEARDVESRLSQCPVKIIEKREYEGVWHTFFGKIC